MSDVSDSAQNDTRLQTDIDTLMPNDCPKEGLGGTRSGFKLLIRSHLGTTPRDRPCNMIHQLEEVQLQNVHAPL